MEMIYPIEQLHDAKTDAEREAVLLDMPFSILMSYQDAIMRWLHLKNHEVGVDYVQSVLSFLRATKQGRAKAYGNFSKVMDAMMEDR